jgi:hypothetical protein
MHLSSVDVITPADSFDLVSLAEVKAFLQIGDTTNDERLKILITFSSLLIADLCDRVFGEEEVSETFYLGSGETIGSLNLNRYPVVGIADINGSTDFTLDREAGIIRGSWAGDTVVTYTGGYLLPDEAPKALSMAALDTIRTAYYAGATAGVGGGGAIRMISDNASGSVSFWPPAGMSTTGRSTSTQTTSSHPLSAAASALIAQYKRPGIA